ncbi:MAG: BatA domain-containing protein [Candidatus Riflebacteria bacterium]|nr:BatA domain-containing protein [Candidatus Riflebacteria bacterium]
MSFAGPLYLTLLVLVPALIALYFKKSRPIRKILPSNRLWAEVQQRLNQNSIFQKYRHSLFLVLQLLVILGIVLGLARPYFKSTLSGKVVIFLDTSASMRATDVAPDRFGQARDKARSILDRLDASGKAALITGDSSVVVRAGFGSDLVTVVALLDKLEPTDHPGPDPEEVVAALDGLRSAKPDRVYILTDQLKAAELAERIRGVSLTVHSFGSRGDNLAVSRFEVRPSSVKGPAKQAAWEAEVVVTNYAPGPVKTTVELRHDGREVASSSTGIGGRADSSVRFSDLKLAPGILEVRLVASSGDDFLAGDNRAWATVGQENLSVLLLGRTTSPLVRVLKSIRGVQLKAVTERESASMATLPEAELVVSDGVLHPGLLRRNAVVLCPGDADGVSAPAWLAGPSVESPLPVRFETTHPLLKYLSLKDVTFSKAATLKRQPGDVEVLGAQDCPLVLARADRESKQVVCAFSTADTDFAMRVGFPIFVVNSLRWIGGDRMASSGCLKLGESYRVPGPLGPEIGLVSPEGRSVTLESSPTPGMLLASSFRTAGVYTVRVGSRQVAVPAVLQSFSESALAPAQDRDLNREMPTTVAVGGGALSTARWLLMLALMVMVVEWALYARYGG